MRSFVIAGLLLAAIAAPAIAEEKAAADRAAAPMADRPASDKAGKSADADIVKAPVEEQSWLSKGSVTVGGRPIAYTAQAGTLTIRDDAGKAAASIFYTAYTAPGANRPVTFFYNGGPGSPTMWLHMGSFGPMRVKTDRPAHVRPADFALAPNPHSLIDVSDLVFIDAVGAGWSRPLEGKSGKDFFGVDQDADAFARAIQRYVEKNNRWTSPKVLFGESYGTLRSGAVAGLLEQRGLALSGVTLLSTILNYGVRQPGYDQNAMVLLPGYAATAWYHNRLANRPPALAPFLDEVRAFVAGPYAAALAKGSAIPEAEAAAIARQISAYTGLSETFIRRADLRVELSQFRSELLRDQRLATGRLDSRYTLDVADANADSPDEDPASTAITGAYYGVWLDYAGRTLNVKTALPYRLTARDSGFDWDWKHRPPNSRQPQTTPNTAVDLAYAMRTNPSLKVLFLNGYYDLATPFYGAEFDAAHMLLPPHLNRNISFSYYESGHMIYLSETALAAMKADVARWYAGLGR